MGSFALSAGHSDAYYERAQEVQRMVEAELACKLQEYDAFILPAAPSPAYLKSEKMNDPLAMYSGDMMTVNVNLSGLPVSSHTCVLTLVIIWKNIKLIVRLTRLGHCCAWRTC